MNINVDNVKEQEIQLQVLQLEDKIYCLELESQDLGNGEKSLL